MTGWLVFGALAVVLVGSAVQVVRSADLVRSVLWLGVTLIGTAVLFVTLRADFLAAVQVLLYVGGVITMMLFGVLLTRRLDSARVLHESARRGRGALCAVAVFGLVVLAVSRTALTADRGDVLDTRALGALFLTDLVLPFEVLSVLLLAAMIGAIALARKSDA